MKIYKKSRKGFTLIELLTAVAITTVIIGVLVGTTYMAMDTWKESRDRTRASRLAKESLEVMARDLEGVVIRSGNTYEWLNAQIDTDIQKNELGPSSAASIRNPLEFVFFTAATDRYDGKVGTKDDKGGDVSTVVYKLVYKDQLDPAGQSHPVYSLYRRLVNPDETFKSYLSQEKLDTIAGNTVTDSENFIAENVYNFTVTLVFEVPNTTGSGKTETLRLPIMARGSDYSEIRIKGDKVETSGSDLPEGSKLIGAELGILVLSDSGMNILNKKPFSSDEDFAKFVKKHSHYFTKSVTLPRS